ncbi:LuxR C-terminal-related transcriptional regulator [Candidatus Berkiella aquae]|uniref:HTH-type quorum sensing-dependent transcriptional regulator VjbR n=1 Tax=Candidatus Berkiella aquae TaxID=295108 RepID=A0A0Q9YJN8_9GAMM|nr:LuxR C-terminal-related transcriptional regulator [Candidatus Berkiella aquae]MCS5711347.1 LuxR C-terminal-related transcriptional regulator [Candidatus Berkiella aquae]
MHSASTLNKTSFLPENHISYEAQSTVQKLIQPLQDKLAITYFNYSVTYPDTSGFTLHNNAKFYESWFKNEFPMCELFFEPGWYSWETCSSTKFIEISQKMELFNGIVLFERQNDKMITTAFATSVENKHVYDGYLNNLNLLKRFSTYFAEQCKSIIDIAQNERIIPLPEKIMRVGVTPNMPSTEELLSNELFYPFNLLSAREQECVKWLINGYSTGLIAEKQKVSINTVNVYISRIKRKLQCFNKQQIIKKAKSLGIIDYLLD